MVIEIIALLIALFSMLAAATSSLLSWRSVKIMERQMNEEKEARFREVRPYIVLADCEFLYSIDWNHQKSMDIQGDPIKLNGSKAPMGYFIPKIRIKNIGTAAAKDLFFDWSFQCKDFKQFIKNASIFKKYHINIDKEKFSIFNNKRGFSLPTRLKDRSFLSYLIATGENSSFTTLEIPPFVYYAIQVYAIAACQYPDSVLDMQKFTRMIHSPPLKVIVKYKSQLNEEIKQDFIIKAGIYKYKSGEKYFNADENKYCEIPELDPDQIKLDMSFLLELPIMPEM